MIGPALLLSIAVQTVPRPVGVEPGGDHKGALWAMVAPSPWTSSAKTVVEMSGRNGAA